MEQIKPATIGCLMENQMRICKRDKKDEDPGEFFSCVGRRKKVFCSRFSILKWMPKFKTLRQFSLVTAKQAEREGERGPKDYKKESSVKSRT